MTPDGWLLAGCLLGCAIAATGLALLANPDSFLSRLVARGEPTDRKALR